MFAHVVSSNTVTVAEAPRALQRQYILGLLARAGIWILPPQEVRGGSDFCEHAVTCLFDKL
jgi:hypothetical protein